MSWVEVDKAPSLATTATLGASWTPFPGGIDVAGSDPHARQTLFFAVAALNTSINAPSYTLSKPGGETANWFVVSQMRSTASTAATALGYVFAIMPETDWNNFAPVVTVTGGAANPNDLAMAGWVTMEGGTIVPRSLDTWIPYINGGAGQTPSSHTLTGVEQPRDGDLCFAFSTATNGVGGAVPGVDSDTTNGSWVDCGGGAVTDSGVEFQSRIQYKIVTARGDQTLNPANAECSIMACLIPHESFSVSQQGGGIDGATADPLWTFVSPTVPVRANDHIYGAVCFKQWDSTSTTPGGYTKDETLNSGTNNASGSQSGSVRGESFHKVADGTEGANVIVALSGTVTLGVGAIERSKCRWTAAEATWLTDTCIGADTDVSGTTISVTASSAITCQPGDRIKWSLMVRPNGLPTSITPSFPGLTGVNYQIQTASTISDPDARIVSGYFEVDTGTASVTPSITATGTVAGASEAVATFTRERLVIIPLPPIITGCDNEGTEDELTFDWVDGGFDPTRYEVRIDGGSWTDVGLVLTHTFTGLAEGSTHTLEVRACNEGGCSASDSVECTTLSGVPTNLTCDTPTQTSVGLCWDDASGSPDYYEVRIDGGTPVTGTSCFPFTGLDPNTSYLLEVRACITGVGCSDYVGIECVTCPADPVNLTEDSSASSINFCWEAGTDGGALPVTFEVRIDGTDDVVGIEELCHLFTGLDDETTYLLEVRTCTEDCCSEWVPLEVTTPQGRAWSVCPCGPGWRIEVCNLKTGVVRGILMPTAMDFQPFLNTQGKGSLTLPVRSVRALDVWPNFTSIYIVREGMDPANDDCLFAGIVRKATGSNGSVTIGMDSIESYLWQRRLKTDLSFSGIGQNQIAAALVAQTLTNGIPLTGVAETPGTPLNRDYLEADRVYIGPLLEQFTNSENGPSWRLEHSKTGGAWSTRIIFADTVGDDRDTVLRSDREGNDYGLDLDSQDHASWIDGFNQATPPLTSTANDLSIYPEFDADPTFDAPLQETLDQQTIGALAARGDIAATPTFTLLGETIKASQMRLGDSAIFHLNQGFIQFHGRARVYGITYRVSEENPLTRELALVPVESAVESVMNATDMSQCPECK